MSGPVWLWRIGTDAPAYQADSLSGTGAEISGGRWNRQKTPMVYTSSTRSLACLETLAHLAGDDPLPLNRYLVEIEIPNSAWTQRAVFDPSANIGWDAEPPGQVSLDWGTNWITGASSLIAEVPSVIVPEESNYLINPRHPDGVGIRARKVRKWTYDVRLGKGGL